MRVFELKEIIKDLPDDAYVLVGDAGDEEAIHHTSGAQAGRIDGDPSDFEVIHDSEKPFNSVSIWPT